MEYFENSKVEEWDKADSFQEYEKAIQDRYDSRVEKYGEGKRFPDPLGLDGDREEYVEEFNVSERYSGYMTEEHGTDRCVVFDQKNLKSWVKASVSDCVPIEEMC